MKIIFTILTFIVAFNFNSHAQCNASFTYTSNNGFVTFYSSDTLKNINHYWNFGNGYSSNLLNSPDISWTYDKGTYNITHVIIDSINNCRDSLTQIIVVDYKDSCNASFTTTDIFLSKDPLMCVSTSFASGATGGINYLWKVDGIDVSDNSVLHKSLPVGSHQICLNMMTSSGCSSSVCRSIGAPLARTTRDMGPQMRIVTRPWL